MVNILCKEICFCSFKTYVHTYIFCKNGKFNKIKLILAWFFFYLPTLPTLPSLTNSWEILIKDLFHTFWKLLSYKLQNQNCMNKILAPSPSPIPHTHKKFQLVHYLHLDVVVNSGFWVLVKAIHTSWMILDTSEFIVHTWEFWPMADVIFPADMVSVAENFSSRVTISPAYPISMARVESPVFMVINAPCAKWIEIMIFQLFISNDNPRIAWT